MHTLHRAFLILLALCLGLATGPAAEAGYERYSASFFDSFDTVIQVLGYAEDLATFEKAYKEAEDTFARLHRLYNKYVPYKDLNNIYALIHEAAKARSGAGRAV